MFNSEQAQQKWGALLDHPDCTPIKDNYRRAVTATLLENQEKAMREERLQQSFLHEANDTVTGDVKGAFKELQTLTGANIIGPPQIIHAQIGEVFARTLNEIQLNELDNIEDQP